MYGAVLALPAKFLSTAEPPAIDFFKRVQQVEMPATGLLQASQVYMQRGGTLPPLSPLYVGPYEVLERADKFFRIAVGGREETVSTDCLKPHLGAGLFSAALPAACGCPPVSAPVVFQPQHPPAAATTGGPVAETNSN